MLNTYISNISLVSTMQLTIVLIVTASIFLVFIAVAIIKMYKLKAENKKLLDSSFYKSDVEKSYQDFTESHLYDNNN
ncbi:hypothetical protein ES692_10010 [Psychroserpens burtonensis]|uniref:Uncharacterized protein n=1 Tax=Psychroserpens burtonensis TaxID=49278 RepID=A0A5C7BFN5_9FLAO|nr:hypothetical protein [Psychroserpens burtonensis]TXE17309.1 hypothetical protein ES692_10010 [Psychroserpens burtonensis]